MTVSARKNPQASKTNRRESLGNKTERSLNFPPGESMINYKKQTKQVKPGFTNYQPRGLAIWNYKNKTIQRLGNFLNNFQQISFANFFLISDFWRKFCDESILLNDQIDVIKAKKVKVG